MKEILVALGVIGFIIFLIALVLIPPTVLWWLWPYTGEPMFNTDHLGWWQSVGFWVILSMVGSLFKTTFIRNNR